MVAVSPLLSPLNPRPCIQEQTTHINDKKGLNKILF